jgi:hypothetical protein
MGDSAIIRFTHRVGDENISNMLDKFLAWLVILVPVALSIVFIFIPTQDQNPRTNMRWRLALVLTGLLFSGVAWWQQTRTYQVAQESASEAINETSRRVSAEVKKSDESIINAQSAKLTNFRGRSMSKAIMSDKSEIVRSSLARDPSKSK